MMVKKETPLNEFIFKRNSMLSFTLHRIRSNFISFIKKCKTLIYVFVNVKSSAKVGCR